MITRAIRAALLAAVLGWGPARADSTPWLAKQWTYRQVVDVAPVTTRLPGDDVGVVQFPTYGLLDQEAPNLLVVSRGGHKVPHYLMSTGPGDRISVAFALSGNAKRYYIYFNDKKAAPPKATAKRWVPHRGVLLEARTYRGGGAHGLGAARKTFQRARPVLGRTFVPNIFIAYNPFGPPGNTCYRYRGHLIVRKGGQYDLAVSSWDACFLLIDDKLVVQWPGRHGWRADAKYSKRVSLKKGQHNLEFYHLHLDPRGGAVVAWRPPGTSKYEPIPPSAFSPVSRGTPRELERFGSTGRRMSAAFSAAWAGETFFANRYTFRYHFEADLGKRARRSVKLQWVLGDGTTSDRASFDHVYLRPGIYPVTLTVKQGAKSEKLTNRIAVNRNWTRLADPKLDRLAQHAKIVAGYSFPNMPVSHLTIAMTLFGRAGDVADQLKIASLIVDRHKQADDQAMIEAAGVLERTLLKRTDGPDRVAKAWARVRARAKNPDTRVRASLHIGRIELDHLDRAQSAKERFERILKNPPAGKRLRREVRIALGDAYLALGDGEKARQAYRAAGTEPKLSKYNLRVPPKIRAIEDFIRRKEFDAAQEQLIKWEWEYPEDRLGGYSALLWVKLHQARNEHRAAVQKALRLVGANKLSPYAAELLLSAYRSYTKLNQKDRARQCLKRIVDDYPESPQWPEAKRLYGP